MPTPAGLTHQVCRWLCYEQTVNDRQDSDGAVRRLDLRSHTVQARYRPENRGVWSPEVVWLPAEGARTYGPIRPAFRTAFGRVIPPGRAPLIMHPQPPAVHRRLRARYGSSFLDDVRVTATSSFRTLLAWRPGGVAVQVKLSLGPKVGRVSRTLTEYYLVTGVLVSSLLHTISRGRRRRIGFDFFPEPGGVVDAESGVGWMLREFPAMLGERGAGELVPMFSLIASRGERQPLLVDLIQASGLGAEQFVIERILQPYVSALAHLLLDEGIQLQGHAQNVLMELVPGRGLTGRVVLRDLIDSSVILPLRLARCKPLPPPRSVGLPAWTPFPLVRSLIDHRGRAGRRWPVAASDTVETWGLRAFVWAINTSLARYSPRYDARRVERAYLTLWRDAVMRHLGVEPLISRQPLGLATDEAIAHHLAHLDWSGLGARNGSVLPDAAEPLPHEGTLRRCAGPMYARLESAWGDLYVRRGRPEFFRPAF